MTLSAPGRQHASLACSLALTRPRSTGWTRSKRSRHQLTSFKKVSRRMLHSRRRSTSNSTVTQPATSSSPPARRVFFPPKCSPPMVIPTGSSSGIHSTPVYLLPLVEVVAGKQTSTESVDSAVDHYLDLGMHPLVVRHEIEGLRGS